MAQKVLNEEQMRKYIENEVRNTLLREGFNEDIDEGLDEGIFTGIAGKIGDWLKGRLEKRVGNSRIGNFIEDHANTEDLINLAIGIFGVGTIAKWICQAIGIDMSSPLANILVRAISGYAALRIGDSIQDKIAANGGGGKTSIEGGNGYTGGGIGGGSR